MQTKFPVFVDPTWTTACGGGDGVEQVPFHRVPDNHMTCWRDATGPSFCTAAERKIMHIRVGTSVVAFPQQCLLTALTR
jgi:hypothetical protein